MTVREVKESEIGSRVRWDRENDEPIAGVIVSRPDLNFTPPHRMIQWDDGEFTDGRDCWALEHVRAIVSA